MNAFAGSLLLVGLCVAGCGRNDSTPPAKSTNTSTGSNPLTAPADYVGAIGQAQKTALKTVDLASVTKAIQLFHAQEDRYPKDLNELIKLQYLSALPQLPSGIKYQYDPNTGQLKTVRQQP